LVAPNRNIYSRLWYEQEISFYYVNPHICRYTAVNQPISEYYNCWQKFWENTNVKNCGNYEENTFQLAPFQNYMSSVNAIL
jgi:hypothetical protein